MKRREADRKNAATPSAIERVRSRRVEELPDALEAGILYIVGEGPHLWLVAMICPCGCRDIIKLSLLPESQSYWSLIVHRDRKVTLWPSVARLVGCRSHFSIRKSRIVNWIEEDSASS